MTDARTSRLVAAVARLRDVEDEILVMLHSFDANGASTLPAGLVEMASARRDALDDYLRSSSPTDALLTETPLNTAAASESLSAAVVELYARFARAAMAYAALFEMSLRLYDPRLREIVPHHLDETAGAASALAEGLARVVSGELASAGLECHCVCPMCSLGACGCVSVGHAAALSLSFRDADDAGHEGFELPRPRRGSQLADAHVAAGDRLLAIDGVPVTTVLDIQTALRRHGIGERVELLVARADSRRALTVTHVNDY